MIYKLLLSICICSSLNSMQKLRTDLVRIQEKRWAIADVASALPLSAQQKLTMVQMLHGLLASIELRKTNGLQHHVKLLRRYNAEARTINKLITRIQ